MRILPSVALVAVAACATNGSDLQRESYALSEDTPEAVGVVRLLNDPHVDETTLDIDVALDRRAARNLVAHRNGPDGFEGTNDDQPFGSLDEVDAIRYVGPSAMAKLLDYAQRNAIVPGPEDILGSFDNVVFTVQQAQETLALGNLASVDELDNEYGLDRRAVNSILDARPIETMSELASLYYVGGSALRALRAEFFAPTDRTDCQTHSECRTDQRCEGIPYDASSEHGKCRPFGNIPGVGENCSVADPCGPELFCGGLTFGGGGMCIGAWQQDTFENSTVVDILQGEEPVVTAATVRGQATVPFDITVDVNLDHSAPHSLRIVLFDPNGTDAVLWDGPNELGNAFPDSFIALGNISRDDTVNGRWLLRIWNVDGTGVGSLNGWSLWLSSNFD